VSGKLPLSSTSMASRLAEAQTTDYPDKGLLHCGSWSCSA